MITAEEISGIIYSNVTSEPDKHFVNRRWLIGVAKAAEQIAALANAQSQSQQPQADWNYTPKPGQRSGPSTKD